MDNLSSLELLPLELKFSIFSSLTLHNLLSLREISKTIKLDVEAYLYGIKRLAIVDESIVNIRQHEQYLMTLGFQVCQVKASDDFYTEKLSKLVEIIPNVTDLILLMHGRKLPFIRIHPVFYSFISKWNLNTIVAPYLGDRHYAQFISVYCEKPDPKYMLIGCHEISYPDYIYRNFCSEYCTVEIQCSDSPNKNISKILKIYESKNI